MFCNSLTITNVRTKERCKCKMYQVVAEPIKAGFCKQFVLLVPRSLSAHSGGIKFLTS